MSPPDVIKVLAAEAPLPFSPEPHLTRRILAHDETMMLVEHRMEPGWAGPRHSHPHQQMVYVISGRLRFRCGAEEFEVGGGDSFLVPGGVEHQGWALAPSVVLDVFTPRRDDYLPRGK